MPFITGYIYRINWGKGLDFTEMQFEPSIMWTDTDKDIQFVLNFTEKREALDFITDFGSGEKLVNGSFVASQGWLSSSAVTGMNIVFNDTETREAHFIVNGKPTNQKDQKILMKGI